MEMTAEIREAIDELGRAHAAFVKANDEALDQKLDRGAVTGLLEEERTRANAAISAAQDRLDELERRVELGSGAIGDGEPLVEAVSAFAEITGRPDLSASDFQAYGPALGSYLRSGSDGLRPELRAALSVGSNPDGGYFVRPDTNGRIVTRVFETSPMRQLASIEPNVQGDALEGIADNEEAAGGWVGETGTRSETATPGVDKWRIPVQECYALPKATQKILDDAGINIEAWLADKIATRLARLENAAFVTGDGVAKPRGFLDYGAASVTTVDSSRAWGVLQHILTGASGTLTDSDHLVALYMALKSHYRANASWAMNRSVEELIRKLKDGDGNYLWRLAFDTGGKPQILGRPIENMEDMPNFAAGSFSIACGDFRAAYQIADRPGISVLRDPYTQKGYVLFYSTRRTGGDVIDFEALKLSKTTA